jgi:hypothetical protein
LDRSTFGFAWSGSADIFGAGGIYDCRGCILQTEVIRRSNYSCCSEWDLWVWGDDGEVRAKATWFK